MVFLKSSLYYLIFFAFTLTAFVIFLPILLLPKAWTLWVPKAWTYANTYLLDHILGLRHKIRGKDNIASIPVIYAVKHQSAWETLFLPHFLKNPAFVLKKELLNIPLFGWYLRKYGMLTVDRSLGSKSLLKMIKQANSIIAEKRPIVIFPEGTRTAPGEKRPYQSGVYLLYSKLQLPVIPVSHNAGYFWPRRSFRKQKGVITVTFHEPIHPGLDRATFMKKLERIIETTCDTLKKDEGKEKHL